MKSLPLLVSYPRSGSHMLRYLTETLTGLRTPGNQTIGLYTTDELAFIKTHSIAKPVWYRPQNCGLKFNKILLLLRNPVESLARSHTVKRGFGFPLYIQNIKLIDLMDMETKIVYYEDLLKDDGIYDVLDWFGYDYDKPNNLDDLRQHSLKFYKSVTRYTPKPITKELIYKASHKCRQELTRKQVNKYLSRYL